MLFVDLFRSRTLVMLIFASLQEKDAYSNVGEPTEAALKVLAEKLPCPDGELAKRLSSLPPTERVNAVNSFYDSRFSRQLTFEFSRDRKMMSVLADSAGHGMLLSKGAPESIVERSASILVHGAVVPMTPQLRAQILEHTVRYGSYGLRTLALAYAPVADPNALHFRATDTNQYNTFERDLIFVGLVGMFDPPRPEVRGAVANCRAAGIRVIVVTGDNKGTAETICRQIGVFDEDEDLTGKSYTGREFEDLTHAEKIEAVQRASLFSRTEPSHKSQLVDLLQSLGLVVAMVSSCWTSSLFQQLIFYSDW
jgi:Ca2+ transporting ATPase